MVQPTLTSLFLKFIFSYFLLCFFLPLEKFTQKHVLTNISPYKYPTLSKPSASTAIFPFYHKCYSISLGGLRNYSFISQTTPFLQHTSSETLWSFLMDMSYSYICRYYLFQIYIPWGQGTIFIRSSYLFFDPHVVKPQDDCRGLCRKCPYRGTLLEGELKWGLKSWKECFFLFCTCAEALSARLYHWHMCANNKLMQDFVCQYRWLPLSLL